MRMIGQTARTPKGRIGRFEPPPNLGDPVRRRVLALLATIGAATLLTACGSDGDTPTQQPPAAPATTEPATTAPASPSGPPTLTKWVNVPCAPEGAQARTTSGGPLVCKKVGSDKQPVWHAGTP